MLCTSADDDVESTARPDNFNGLADYLYTCQDVNQSIL